MERRQTDYSRLKLLTTVTTAALIGIVALQVFWLRMSYKEQQLRFRADVESAMTYALIRERLSAGFAQQPSDNEPVGREAKDSLANMLGSLLSLVGQARSRKPSSLTDNHTPKANDTTRSRLEAMIKSLEQLKDSEPDTSEPFIEFEPTASEKQPPIDLGGVKKSLEIELNKRAIYTPAELALTDASGRIFTATCDTARFQRIPVKSSLSGSWIMDGKVQLQTAFPDADVYLLRNMIWILSVTALLILLSTASFLWLIRIFFRQKRLADIRNDFLNNMTHELKTPISSVAVALDLIRNKEHPIDDSRKEEYLSIAQGELTRLNMLVEKVLKMAAFERSEIHLSREHFLVTPWINGIANSMRPVLHDSHSRLTLKVEPEQLLLFGDKTHLTNLVQNLLENAVKYNGTDSPRIFIRIADDGPFITFSVSDNGRGIPEIFTDKVFDKFFRVPTGDRHDIKGYGLGLSYVKAIAELHGGHVSVSSTPDVATTFTVTLPKVAHT